MQMTTNTLDFMLGFSVMILGNTPDEVQEAIIEALPRGTHYGQCHEHEYEVCEAVL
jgi:glutamate-1-semialdehyde aminotransferase